jgi:acyl-CoA synthetase (AMP-forming)/AMP-acid ligase II
VTPAQYTGTIPGLLLAAADRDPDGTWLRSDAGELTFGGALSAVAATAQALSDAGVGRGHLVMLTAATTPEYLLTWLAVTSLGAVAVAVNPRGTTAELAGLIGQVSPRVVVTDPGCANVVAAAVGGGSDAAGGQPGALRLG